MPRSASGGKRSKTIGAVLTGHGAYIRLVARARCKEDVVKSSSPHKEAFTSEPPVPAGLAVFCCLQKSDHEGGFIRKFVVNP